MEDGRTRVRHGDMQFDFPEFGSRAAWEAHREHLRRRILVSAGLWPLPEREPLQARVTGRVEHDDYSIENVYFESRPGFFVTGNLYRPRGKQGPFAGVLSPHGHWEHGRLEHGDLCSVPGRCINLARLGCVVFAYDMVGYNDSGLQAPHTRGGDETAGVWDDPTNYLWGTSLLGLQLWNSIRAVDFLASLDDVDAQRLGCTGASGGGTQTFLLTAVDERIKVAAPVNMISAHMQGGCLCENAPGLRLDTDNVEIGAMMAPRPLLMVSATGDWTKNTPTVEHPAIRGIYRLYDAEERVAQVQVDAGHNYNRQSREAVYAWFARWLLGRDDAAEVREQPYSVEPAEAMRVFPDGKLPARAVDAGRLIADAATAAREQVRALLPTDAATLQAYRELMGTAYRYAVNAAQPDASDLVVELAETGAAGGYRIERLTVGTKAGGERVPALLLAPERARGAVLLVQPEGKAGLLDGGAPTGPARPLLDAGLMVMGIDVFGVGEAAPERHRGVPHFLTFNRSDAALRLQDILTAIAYLRTRAGTVHLVGAGEAGLWCLLARALASGVARTVVDADQLDVADDGAWAERLYIPHIRRAGDLRTAAALTAPGPLLVHNAAASFPGRWFRQVYAAAGAPQALRVEPDAIGWQEVAACVRSACGKPG